MRMRTLIVKAATAAIVLALPALAEETPLTAEQQVALLQNLKPSFVQVEYTLRYDKGEAPKSGGHLNYASYRRYRGFYGLESYVKEERPLEASGVLLAPNRVITLDVQIHPRFIEKIQVRAGDELVDATIAAYHRHENSVILETALPLLTAKPITFVPDAEGPYLAVSRSQFDGAWVMQIESVPTTLRMADSGLRYRAVTAASLIINRDGTPAGMSMNGELPVGDSWRGSPAEWPAYSATEMAALLAKAKDAVRQGLLHVTLKFRSPKKDRSNPWMSRGETETEAHVVGVMVGPQRLLVLANLKPKVTARLETIQVRLPDGTKVDAEFEYTIRDYGCFTATLESGTGAPIDIVRDDIRDFRHDLILSAEVKLYGESRTDHYLHTRIPSFDLGHKRHVYPDVPQEEQSLFLLTPAGELLAAPVLVREKVESEDRWSDDSPELTPIAYVTSLLSDVAEHTDPSNVPLSEEQESRIAWLGVEMQNLDTELARVNEVSELTRDGSFGALVSYVYPDSPAARAGVKPGYILLRLHVEDHPKPIPVRTDDERFGVFPWDRLDEVPEQYFDQIPQPWPAADNNFTRTLTDLGFGKKYAAEFFHDGETIRKTFEVVQSPPHYDTAKRFKPEELGLTVRDLTYEVRRYFQKQEDEPGVIISKIEQGSKTSVAGLKPYEIITHINDEPVANVAMFEEKLGNAGEELRLNVKRMTRGRIVKMKLDPATESASDDATGATSADENTEDDER